MNLIAHSTQSIQIEITHPSITSDAQINFVYESCNGKERRSMWEDLINTQCTIPSLVIGDFNVVAYQEEKMRGCLVNLNDVGELIRMIQQTSLSNLGYVGSKYTWSNNRLRGSTIVERLDRALGSNDWISQFFSKVDHLHRTCSDHAPLLLTLSSLGSQGSSFRFLNVWATHHQFQEIVVESWGSGTEGRPMIKFSLKLKAA